MTEDSRAALHVGEWMVYSVAFSVSIEGAEDVMVVSVDDQEQRFKFHVAQGTFKIGQRVNMFFTYEQGVSDE